MLAASRLRPLALRDASRVPPDADPAAIAEEFNSLWTAQRSLGEDSSGRLYLRRALVKLVQVSLTILWAARVLCAALALSCTIFLHALLQTISLELSGDSDDQRAAAGYAAGLGLCMIWCAIMSGQYEYYVSIEAMKARAALASAVLRTTLQRSYSPNLLLESDIL